MEKKLIVVQMIVDNAIIEITREEDVKVGTILHYGKCVYRVDKVNFINAIQDKQGKVEYYVCICTNVSEHTKYGVLQTKLFCDANYEYLENMVNNFLYENRHKYEIVSVEYNYYGVFIKYKMRSKEQMQSSISKEYIRTL